MVDDGAREGSAEAAGRVDAGLVELPVAAAVERDDGVPGQGVGLDEHDVAGVMPGVGGSRRGRPGSRDAPSARPAMAVVRTSRDMVTEASFRIDTECRRIDMPALTDASGWVRCCPPSVGHRSARSYLPASLFGLRPGRSTTRRGRWTRRSAAWLQDLTTAGPVREDAEQRLHALLLRACRAELGGRRRARAGHRAGVDDLAEQAATDATLAVLGKLDRFRGESRFTTWAYAFAVFEVSTVLGPSLAPRASGSRSANSTGRRCPTASVRGPEEIAQARELVRLVRRAVDEELTPRQRALFLAVVVEGVPLDALVDELGTTRGAVYKTVFDARRKIRQFLDANGYLGRPEGRPAMSGTGTGPPCSTGCSTSTPATAAAITPARSCTSTRSWWRAARTPRAAHPAVAAHLRSCGPCFDDLEGLLALVTGEER